MDRNQLKNENETAYMHVLYMHGKLQLLHQEITQTI